MGMARYKFHLNKFSMGFHQKKLADLSQILGRFRSIYKWNELEQSQIFCLLSIFGGIILFLVPLRYLFSAAVFGIFFKHSPWRSDKEKTEKGAVDRYFESIPPDIPQVDSDSEDEQEDTNADATNGEENESFIDRIKRIRKNTNTSSDDTDS